LALEGKKQIMVTWVCEAQRFCGSYYEGILKTISLTPDIIINNYLFIYLLEIA
jgi:hypothetical protein